ncbi:MAG: toprim domain-containing protein [Bryobacterales bacterium]|nr:toprim domain-containing protein [Bryobacterales bacterium]
MMNVPPRAFPARISLLEFLIERGWKPVRDGGREEVAGLCPLHEDHHPSFYVNRRKQVFYCHGCGRGGGLGRLIGWLADKPQPASASDTVACGPPLAAACRFYQQQLARAEEARAYLVRRGIHDQAMVSRMGIGYAPGACLRGGLERLGYRREALRGCGLIDAQDRDVFFRCLTFPLEGATNLYGRSIANHVCRHRFLPGAKGGLYGLRQALAFPNVIVVEGLFDVAALWQAGFDNAVAALGAYLNHQQIAELCRFPQIYICFDADRNGSGQSAARRLSVQLRHAGAAAWRVELPLGQDPASFLGGGASAADLRRCLEQARP